MSKYKVRFFQNNEYEVVKLVKTGLYTSEELPVFQGSLADCEAFIRLNEGGYM